LRQQRLILTTQHNTTQHNTTQHNTTQHNSTQHNTTQHNSTQHNTTQHNTTQLNSTQLNSTQHNSTQLNSTQHSINHGLAADDIHWHLHLRRGSGFDCVRCGSTLVVIGSCSGIHGVFGTGSNWHRHRHHCMCACSRSLVVVVAVAQVQTTHRSVAWWCVDWQSRSWQHVDDRVVLDRITDCVASIEWRSASTRHVRPMPRCHCVAATLSSGCDCAARLVDACTRWYGTEAAKQPLQLPSRGSSCIGRGTDCRVVSCRVV
jgi:hypothetical protein